MIPPGSQVQPVPPRRRWWLPRLHTINWALLVGGLMVVAALRAGLSPDTWMKVGFVVLVVGVPSLPVCAVLWAYRRGRRKTLSGVALLCLAVIISAGLFVLRAVRREEALRAIDRAGGQVLYPGQAYAGNFGFWAPQWLRDFFGDAAFDPVAQVWLVNSPVTQGTLAHLSAFPEIDTVRVSLIGASPARVAQLRRLPNLQNLYLTQPEELTDDLLAEVAEIRTLVLLNLGACNHVTDKGLAKLRKLPRLQRLSVQQGVDDDGLKQLVQIPFLRRLDLHFCSVTDVGLDHVRRYRGPSLVWIELGHSTVTQRAVDKLRQTPPGLRLNVWPIWLAGPYSAIGNERPPMPGVGAGPRPKGSRKP